MTSEFQAAMLSTVAWFYLATNSLRVVSYVPQIVAVWRCDDGARSISLLTWGSWVISHIAATLYGVLIVKDTFFILISLVNLAGCGAVAGIAAHRRALLRGSARTRLGRTPS